MCIRMFALSLPRAPDISASLPLSEAAHPAGPAHIECLHTQPPCQLDCLHLPNQDLPHPPHHVIFHKPTNTRRHNTTKREKSRKSQGSQRNRPKKPVRTSVPSIRTSTSFVLFPYRAWGSLMSSCTTMLALYAYNLSTLWSKTITNGS